MTDPAEPRTPNEGVPLRKAPSFADLAHHAEVEAKRAEIWREELRRRAADPAEAGNASAIAEAISWYSRLIDIYRSFHRLAERCGCDEWIKQRLREIAAEEAHRDALPGADESSDDK